MSNNSLNVSVLGAAKETYTDQLRIHLIPVIHKGFVSLYEDAKQLEHAKGTYNYLKRFQMLLKDIPKWNQSILEEETHRILSEIEFLMELVTAVFVSHVKILASVKLSGNNRNIRIKIPTSDVFIHTVYTKTAEFIYYDPWVFNNYNHRENYEKIREFIAKGINDTISSMIPIESILKEYLSNVFAGHIKEMPQAIPIEEPFSRLLSANDMELGNGGDGGSGGGGGGSEINQNFGTGGSGGGGGNGSNFGVGGGDGGGDGGDSNFGTGGMDGGEDESRDLGDLGDSNFGTGGGGDLFGESSPPLFTPNPESLSFNSGHNSIVDEFKDVPASDSFEEKNTSSASDPFADPTTNDPFSDSKPPANDPFSDSDPTTNDPFASSDNNLSFGGGELPFGGDPDLFQTTVTPAELADPAFEQKQPTINFFDDDAGFV